MDIQQSRDGFYTITFVNNYKLTPNKIKYEFNTVGFAKISTYRNNKYFIKYATKEEAVKAILKYGKIYKVSAATDSPISNKKETFQGQPEINISYNLILGNLPKNYNIENVKHLIEEVQFLAVTEIEETKFLKLKFCHIILSSDDELKYLIKKLDKFILHGEKLIAIDAKDLLSYHEIFNEKFNKTVPSPAS